MKPSSTGNDQISISITETRLSLDTSVISEKFIKCHLNNIAIFTLIFERGRASYYFLFYFIFYLYIFRLYFIFSVFQGSLFMYTPSAPYNT